MTFIENQYSDTRLFFVVDSIEDNEEIFETFGEAKKWYDTLSLIRKEDEIGEPNEPRIRVCYVLNAYRETNPRGWNYDDEIDTFETITTIK